jgi:two-component system chemotaxis response regulator CheB
MTEVRTGVARHYRCHVGHAYGPASLLHAQEEAAEAALWTAVASMEERAGLHRELAEAALEPAEREQHHTRAQEVGEQAKLLRRQLRHGVTRG